jgi:tetratricopeptide (TPR) repeat protein
LAEYAEHLLSEPERSRIEQHLVSCRDCRDAVLAAAAFAAEDGAHGVSTGSGQVVWFRRRTAAVAAILTAAAAVLLVVRLAPWSDRTGAEFARLARAAAAEPTRPVSGRIAGFAYAPSPSATRGAGNVDVTPALRIAAAEVETKLEGVNSPDAAHTLGLAYLLVGDADRAVARLADAAARAPDNAAFASDLAAAYLARAERDRNPADARLAIVAADRALRLDPNLAEARFNRALALAALPQPDVSGLEDYARREQSQWADEARQRAAAPARSKPIVFRSIAELKSNRPFIDIRPFGEPKDIQVNAGTESKNFPATLFASDAQCSAVFIGPDVLLTAAHCFSDADAHIDAAGHRVWDVRAEVGGTTVKGDCERPDKFVASDLTASIPWDLALCRMSGSPKVAFEVISNTKDPIAVDADVLLTGYGIDLASGSRLIGQQLRFGKARVTHADVAGLMRTCGASLDEGDSGGGTYVYFDAQFMHRVMVAVNAWKRSFDCGTASAKSSEMAGLWNAQQFIDQWHHEYKKNICGIHAGIPAGKCRNPAFPGTVLVP